MIGKRPVSWAAQVGSNLEESVDSKSGGIGRNILRASKKDQQRSRSKRHLAAKLPGRKKGRKVVLLPWDSIEQKGRALSHDIRIRKEKANAKILQLYTNLRLNPHFYIVLLISTKSPTASVG